MQAKAQPVVTLFESMSLNGIIARPNDDAGFLTDINYTSWIELVNAAGAMVWGRETHEMFRGALADMPLCPS